MKNKFLALVLLLVCTVTFAHSVSALCDPMVSLLNQDPYPAVPGEYTRIVFQVTGVENPECETLNFMLQQDYPISLDPGVSPAVSLEGGAYLLDFGTFFLIPYKVRVDEGAIDGNYTIKVNYGFNNNPLSLYHTREFELIVNDTNTDFDVFVDSYSSATNTLTLNIVNVGENDANALIVSLPSQAGLNVTAGADKTVGKLSATDDTTVSFTAIPENTNELQITISYTDAIGKRRSVEKTVPFTASSYAHTAETGNGLGVFFYLFILTWLIIAVLWILRVRKNRRKKKMDAMKRHS